jgi:anti-sigma B factor antagonist
MLSRSSSLVDDLGAFTCTVRSDTDAVVLAPEGELDLATAPVLDDQLHDVRDAGCRKLVVDLRGLTFIDSTGVQLLLRWAAWAARNGRAFSLIPGSERVQMVFAITGIVDRLAFDRPSP